MEAKMKQIANVNHVAIMMQDLKEKLVPIRPICQALGIDEDSQKRKIEADDSLSSVATLSVATGVDGKEYKMFCIPLKYVFGWLFTINPKNVKEESRESVKQFRDICYDVLYRYFTEHSDFIEEKGKLTDKYYDIYRKAQESFKTAKATMDEARKQLEAVRKASFEEWKANNNQMALNFDAPLDEQ